jgi:hypothetical protein
MREAWEQEESPAAKAALTQVLVNSRMCAVGKRPICQDTGSNSWTCWPAASRCRWTSPTGLFTTSARSTRWVTKDMPVTLAVDSRGDAAHQQGPRIWSARIAARIGAMNL